MDETEPTKEKSETARIELEKLKAERTKMEMREEMRKVHPSKQCLYEGCACDVSSHLYSYSFELNPIKNDLLQDWSANFSSQPEILDYLKNVANKHKLYQRICFQHEVKTITWNEEINKWIVKYVNLSLESPEEETQIFDLMICGTGALRLPYIPNEFKTFTGPTIHTGQWNNEIDLRNKKVAVIGSGASAVQVIPSIVDSVDTLHCYQRKPPYIIPRPQFDFPNFIKTVFFYLPFIMWLFRCFIYMFHELLHAAFISGSILNKMCNKITRMYRHNELKNHEHLIESLTPNYGFGCKRVIMSEQYYAAMARPNVHIHSSHVDKVVGQTIFTKDGSRETVDVLILATGFLVHGYFAPLQVFGKDGENILQTWALGHNSVLFMIECQVNFVVRAVREMMRQNAQVISVKVSAEEEFMDKLKADLKHTVWYNEKCGSWYANSRDVITTLWSGNCTSYWRQTANIDWSKFDFISDAKKISG
ncbi:Baeyer-Villiger monooxygenase [Pseudolycoriella hygida]|uniref:Flavin-containing monooxygenase n=1 Tax=Pseudolycoriella hygida TaxID=35572 RepID=A0A9Q0MZD6_9DIPT|nr:Baeyer-Villiger monooxygenase [Pseudolycoriella hygida]